MRKKLFLLANYLGIIWVICILGFLVVVAVASGFATHDPDFSQGMAENVYLLPMLFFIFLGFSSFIIMTITGLASFFMKRGIQIKSPLGLSFKKLFLFVAIILFGLFSFLFAFRQNNLANGGGKYTGQEIFDAVNDFRKQNDKSALVIEPAICDNLVQRWLDIKNPDKQYEGHPGFVRWVETEGLINYVLAEVYVKDTKITQDAINFWNGSPGHRTAILGDYKYGCAYANEGIAVVILGNLK